MKVKMNETQANEMARFFRETGKFSRVLVGQFRGEWEVQLWTVNSSAGNRNLTVVRDFEAKKSDRARVVRKATGKATKRDKAAFARMADADAET